MTAVRRFMTPEMVHDAASYMRQNEVRLMAERPGDVAFAEELTKELGHPYNHSHARALRLQHHIKTIVVLTDGEKVTREITWKPAVSHGCPKGHSFIKNSMELSAAVRTCEKRLDRLADRVNRIEQILTELGATI